MDIVLPARACGGACGTGVGVFEDVVEDPVALAQMAVVEADDAAGVQPYGAREHPDFGSRAQVAARDRNGLAGLTGRINRCLNHRGIVSQPDVVVGVKAGHNALLSLSRGSFPAVEKVPVPFRFREVPAFIRHLAGCCLFR
ncbi:MAG: hypothetical protein ACOXZM_10370 [Eubacteriales bacterium]